MAKRLTLRIVLTAAVAATALAGCGLPSTPGGLGAWSAQGFEAEAKKKKHGLGAKLAGRPKVAYDEAPAARHFYADGEMGAFASLPGKVDLRAKCPPIYNQGTMGSCTGFAVAKGLGEFVLKKQNRHQELSALYLYYMERKAEHTLGEDAGAQIATGMKVLDNLGAAPEADHPYPASREWENAASMKKFLTLKPDNADVEAGKKFRIAGVKPIGSLRGIRASVAKGMPVVLGIAIFDSFYAAKKGLIPVPDPEKEKMQGGHAIMCVGYDNAKQVLIMRNSWGADWGDRGYFYLPYDFIRLGLAADAWTAKI